MKVQNLKSQMYHIHIPNGSFAKLQTTVLYEYWNVSNK